MKNLLIIMADEMRHDITLHENYPFVQLPNLDRLRSAGITAANFFSQYPICCPSRASFISGKYPHQIGLWNNRCEFPAHERDLGHHLKDHGYDPVAFGKTHNMNPGFRSIQYDIDTAMEPVGHGYGTPPDVTTLGTYTRSEDEYCDFLACSQFAEYVTSRADDAAPFAAFVGIYAPHPPQCPPKRFKEMYADVEISIPAVPENEEETKPAIQGITRARWQGFPDATKLEIIHTYLGMCTLVDECIGRLLDTLKDAGLLDDTIVVFTSDHGEQLGEHNMVGKFHNNYEGSLRSPFVLRLPQDKHGGTVMPQLIEMLDVYPTVCELLNVPLPEGVHAVSGHSFSPAFTDSSYEHRNCVHSMIEDAHMVRTDKWKLVSHANDRGELYNLKQDPGEADNLYEKEAYRQIRTELELRLLKHLLQNKPTVIEGKNGYFG